MSFAPIALPNQKPASRLTLPSLPLQDKHNFSRQMCLVKGKQLNTGNLHVNMKTMKNEMH